MNSFKLEKNTSKEQYGKRSLHSFVLSVLAYAIAYGLGAPDTIVGAGIGTLGLILLLVAIFSFLVYLFKKPTK